jgi:hypothetical protein
MWGLAYVVETITTSTYVLLGWIGALLFFLVRLGFGLAVLVIDFSTVILNSLAWALAMLSVAVAPVVRPCAQCGLNARPGRDVENDCRDCSSVCQWIFTNTTGGFQGFFDSAVGQGRRDADSFMSFFTSGTTFAAADVQRQPDELPPLILPV